MSTSNEKLEQMKKELDELKAKVESAIKKEAERFPLAWKPQRNEEYFGIGADGTAGRYTNYNQNYTDDKAEVGNCFRTAKLRDAELNRRQVLCQIEELVDKYDFERGGAFVYNCTNFTFSYSVDSEKIIIDDVFWMIHNPLLPFFSSKEIAQRILNEVGEENIKLFYTKYGVIKPH